MRRMAGIVSGEVAWRTKMSFAVEVSECGLTHRDAPDADSLIPKRIKFQKFGR